jgi:DNA-binding beta-propeller fold protein YncE
MHLIEAKKYLLLQKKNKMKKITYVLATILASSITMVMPGQSVNPSYKLAQKISVPGEAGWDYLVSDDSLGRLYISHGNFVQVVEEKTGKLVGIIPETKGVHGIALAQEFGKGFISNGKDTSVTVFDLRTLMPITKIKVTGNNPDAILYDPFSHKIFSFNGRSANATIIDAISNQVIGTIELEGKPEFAVTDNNGKIYVNIEDKSRIAVINTMMMKVEQSWTVLPGQEPSGLALDNKNHRLFTVCDNRLMIVLDAQNGRIIAPLPIGGNVDGVAFDPSNERVFSSNGDGTLTVVQGENGDKYRVLENIATQKGARTITLNKKNHHLYLPAAEYEEAPAPTPENPKPRPGIRPGSFIILDIEPLK